VSAHGPVWVWLGVLSAVLLVSGCAVKRIENGVYHSSKGYRVAVPGSEWASVGESPADLELRYRSAPAGMAVHAECGGATRRRAADVLARQLLIGLRNRAVIERGTTEIAGRPASRAVVDGRLDGATADVRVETLVMKDGRCVYDFMYVAPPATFDATRADFIRFVDSFRTE
jgi:hypothetical protein